jgi:hypothetical protein
MADASLAAIRAADGLLRSAGKAVVLRMPFTATAGDTTEQLGLAVPEFQDVTLWPVVYRKARATVAADGVAKMELMVSATAVEGVVGSLGYSAASVLFGQAFGMVVDGVLMEVVSVTTSEVGQVPYLYRLVLLEPLALVV